MIFNSPNNPTGAVYSPQELKVIASIARKYNVMIISDEIYAEITFPPMKYTSIAAFCPERTVITTGLSKGFCAGGYRLGIILVPEKMKTVVSRLMCIASETFSCVCTPVQYSAMTAFSTNKNVRSHVKDTVAIHKMAGMYLYNGFQEIGLRCPEPEGAFYLFPDFASYKSILRKKGIRTDADLCLDLLDKQKVALLPGSAFGVPKTHLGVRAASVDYNGAEVLKAFRSNRPSNQKDRIRFIERYCPNLTEGIIRIEKYLTA
jgi:aspartate/methionine/tyrosine aminotransferase